MAQQSNEQSDVYTHNGVSVPFPFKDGAWWVTQESLVDAILDTLDGLHNAALESPTGTGKTLVILATVMRWIATYFWRDVETNEWKEPPPRVFYLTRTHDQLDQVIDTFRILIKHLGFGAFNMVRLASRKYLCINDDVLRDHGASAAWCIKQ